MRLIHTDYLDTGTIFTYSPDKGRLYITVPDETIVLSVDEALRLMEKLDIWLSARYE